MKRLFVVYVFLLSLVQLVSAASAKEEADKAYQDNDFKGAIEKYEAILNAGDESADIYYNLGNSYFKDKNMAKAILNYERALLLNPGDSDTRFNLEMARSKTVDQITPASEVFIVTWINALTNLMSESGWGRLGIISFILLLVGMVFYIFGNRIWVKKVGFISAFVLLLVTIFANVFAGRQKEELVIRNGAIIMSPTVTVKSTPDESGTDLFVLHEGTKVYIEDNSMTEWKEIRLEDGNKGWVQTKAIEVI
ncbi:MULTISPECIES: tetratricopeptide repeat protein [Phocaeicola]|uniref:Tetratricopeptide repeat protein n=1 Tax=Phocaeicola faecium TaxID=2762213 RepID=A0ABR8V8U7_9BACT|nr:tetratricopeptide repeat protein [Phocaeicola faecium]MBD8001117.1 tetratricopeptide repeat protein [Phocaeicola faecium]